MMLLPTITLLSSGVLKQDLISLHSKHSLGFPCGSAGKESPAMRETWVQSRGWEDPMEKGKATHSSILAWRISWTV